MHDDRLHYVVVTGIIVRDNSEFLIAKRSEDETAFPGLWTVPGGKLEKDDYMSRPKDTPDHWYNVLEQLLRREIQEEVGLEVENIRYLLDLAYKRSDGVPTIIISLFCDYAGGDVELEDELTDFAWVTEEELSDYEFVPGLREEIEMVAQKLRGVDTAGWGGKHDDVDGTSVRDGRK